MFIDCADRAIAAPDLDTTHGLKRTLTGFQPTAMVCAMQKDCYVATLHKDSCPTNLRVVDPYDDPHVWAIVDDGCNACTHSDAWRKNAEEKWNKLGFNSYLKNGQITQFTGVGSAPSTGKWKMPVGLKLVESQLVLPGAIESHEIANAKHPLLISQSSQAALGFTKSSRKGSITLDDYQNQGLEVVRQAKTGLFMIRIDHLFPKQYVSLPLQLRSLLSEQPQPVDSSEDESETEN